VTWHMGLVVGHDVACTVGGGSDVAVANDENTLAWPIWALARGMGVTAMMEGWWWWVEEM